MMCTSCWRGQKCSSSSTWSATWRQPKWIHKNIIHCIMYVVSFCFSLFFIVVCLLFYMELGVWNKDLYIYLFIQLYHAVYSCHENKISVYCHVMLWTILPKWDGNRKCLTTVYRLFKTLMKMTWRAELIFRWIRRARQPTPWPAQPSEPHLRCEP